ALPHVYTDFWMAQLSPTANVTMLAFYRMTIGWQHVDAAITFPKLAELTGIASYDTLTQDIEELIAAGLISRKEQRGKNNSVTYLLIDAATTFTDYVKRLQEGLKDKTFTSSVKPPLQNPKKPFFRKRKTSLTDSVKTKSRKATNQDKQEQPPRESEREAKETSKESFKEKNKEMPPQALPSAGADDLPAPAPLVEQRETKKEKGHKSKTKN